MIRRALGALLYHANTNPYALDKDIFYCVKARILKRFGRVVDYDIQLLDGIRCRCGSGRHYSYYDGYLHADVCWHCGGTGWYKPQRIVLLRKYRLGRYTFHVPLDTFLNYRASFRMPVTFLGREIRGYVTHRTSHFASEASAWLFLFFRPAALLDLLRRAPISSARNTGPFNLWWEFLKELRHDTYRRTVFEERING